MTSPLRESIAEACKIWTNPKLATPERKRHWLEQGRIPTPLEEVEINLCLEGSIIPATEWGAVCLVAENVRRQLAEREIESEASQQIAEGQAALEWGAERYLRWPWKALHDLVGGMAPGTVHIVACPSKGGKTTLMRSASDLWARQGIRGIFGGFEMPAKMLRAMYAADSVGIDPGAIVTGAWLERPDRDTVRANLKAAFQAQEAPGSHYKNIAYSSETNVTPQAVKTMMQQAADWGAQYVILDHLENVSTTVAGNGYQNASAVCHLLADLAKKHELVVIGTSQLNTADKRTDPWRDHRPIRVEHCIYGAVKMQVATTMLGFYRPVKPSLTKMEKQEVESRERQIYDVLTPNVNAANLIASRPFASRIGQKALMGWERGRIVDLPMNEAESLLHGIPTAKRY